MTKLPKPLSSIKDGHYFVFEKEKYIKVNSVHYTSLYCERDSKLDAVKLSDGVLYHWFVDIIVLEVDSGKGVSNG